MSKERMELTGYLIVALEDQLEPIEALRELIENSEKENAARIDIEITSESFTFTDNGTGCDDPNAIFTPGVSRSRLDERGTGSKGIGFKEAAACFGRTWEVHTVTRAGTDVGLYRHHKITWDPEGPLPYKYAGDGSKPQSAPYEIRNGGTKIIVTDRKEGFPRLTMARLESWCGMLEKSYRPALSRDFVIHVAAPDIGFQYKLRNTALDPSKFISKVEEIKLKAADRALTVRYGVLKQADDVLSGCHYIWGPRTVEDTSRINGHSLPLRCYIDIILAPEWKLLLSTNKGRVRYREEIDDVVTSALRAWLEQQNQEATSYKIQLQLGRAAAPVNKIIAMLNEQKSSTWQQKPREPKKPGERKRTEKIERPIEPRQFRQRRRQAVEGGLFGVQKEDKTDRCLELDVRPDKDLGIRLYRASIKPSEKTALIYINVDPAFHPDMEALFKNGQVSQIIAAAYAETASLEPAAFAPLFAAIRNVDPRYNMLDESTAPDQIRAIVSNFFYAELAKQQPKIRKAA